MNIEELRSFCLSLDGATEGFPFGESTLVFKACGKIFALVSLDTEELRVNLKCDPELAVELREQYNNCVLPGYHMNKKHWNTVIINGTISDKILIDWINNSHRLVVNKLSKSNKLVL
jgi:predicted DNA-binding protein (MmcQ/YjbR family)